MSTYLKRATPKCRTVRVFRTLMLYLIGAIGLFASAQVAQATTYTWTGARSTDATLLDNWSPLGIPGAADTVMIGANQVVNASGIWTVANLTLEAGCVIQGTGTLTITGTLTDNGANLDGTGQINLPAGSTLNFNGGANSNCRGKRPIVSSGQVNLTGGTRVTSSFKQTGGAIHLNGGNLKLVTDTGAKGTLEVQSGIVDGIGTIDGNVTNSGGRLKPGHSPGIITINGNYTQTANGSLDMEIGGTTPGTGHDQLVVNGSASLAGALNLVVYNGWLPNDGDNFQLLTYYSQLGTFATTTGLNPDAYHSYRVSLAPTYYVAQAYVSLDTTAPSVAVTAPLNDKGYSSFTTASGTASDAGTVASVTGVLYRYAAGSVAAGFWAGGTTWSSTYTSASNERPCTGTTSWSLTLPALAAGQYYFRATAKDKAGNASVTAYVPFWFDTTVPATVTFTSPTSAAFVNNLNSISGTATDNSGGSGITRVDLTIKRQGDATFWNGSAWTASSTPLTTTFSGSNWSRSSGLPTGTLLTNGSYSLTATAYDKAGNNKSLGISVTVDTTAPTISVTTPALNSSYTTLSSTTGTAADVGGSNLASVTICLYRQATASTTAAYWGGSTTWTAAYSASNECLASGTTSWSLTLPTLSNGPYALRATAKDKAGNVTSSAFIAFAKAAGTSALGVSSASAGAAANNVKITFTGTLDATIAANLARYAVTVNGVAVSVQSAAYASNVVTLTLPAGSVPAGASVVAKWNNIFDTTGKTLTGNSGTLTAK